MNNVLIPYKYTKYAHITSLPFLYLSYLCRNNNHIVTSNLFVLCYILTNLHWYNLKKNGFIRYFDILVVLVLFISCYIDAYKYDCFKIYCVNTIITIGGFSFNEYLNELSLYNPYFEHWFSNEIKIKVYKRSVFMHLLFVHILMSCNGLYVLFRCKKVNCQIC